MANPFIPPLRPPTALTESQFIGLCIRCGKCIEACPHNSLRFCGGFGRNRLTPYIAYEDAPCQLCMKCNQVCPTGALDPAITDFNEVKMGQAFIITDKCHNFADGTMCMTCYDRCPLRGKAIVLDAGLTPAPTKACAGCGVCSYVCPVDAIVILPKEYPVIPENSLALAK